MPQFDQFSFFNQASCFLIFFCLVYFFITYYFLPLIISLIKFRRKRLKVIFGFLNNFKSEIKNNTAGLVIIYRNTIQVMVQNVARSLRV